MYLHWPLETKPWEGSDMRNTERAMEPLEATESKRPAKYLRTTRGASAYEVQQQAGTTQIRSGLEGIKVVKQAL